MLPVPLASTSDPDAITKAAAGFDLAAAEATVIPAGGQAICAIRAILGANVFDWSVVSTHQVHARFPWDQVCVCAALWRWSHQSWNLWAQ